MAEIISRNQRRALSTIVGSLLFMLIILSAFGTMMTGLDHITSFQQTSMEVSNRNFDQANERLNIAINIDAANCLLHVQTTNSGSNSIEIVELFLLNATDNVLFRYDVANALVAPGITRDVADYSLLSLNGLPVAPPGVIIATNKSYQVKVVTKLGTVQQASFSVGNSCNINLTNLLVGKLLAIPPEIASDDEITVAFVVVNRGTNDLTNIELAGGSPNYPLTITPSNTVVSQALITSGSEPSLVSGGSVVFKWNVKLRGAIGQSITIQTSATASGGTATTGTESVTVKITKEFIKQTVSQKLVAKPEIFVIVPGPFGEATGANSQGLWGVMVANPTDVPLTVSRIIISLTTSITDRNERLIDNNGTPCPRTAISPNTASEWTCPEENLIQWADTAAPELVPARDVRAFLAAYQPGTLGGGGDDPAFLVSASVFTSLGYFSKGNYISGMAQSGSAIANIYATTATLDNGSDALDITKMRGSISMTAAGGPQDVRIALADLSDTTSAIINGARLIVNVPAGFGVSGLPGSTTYFSSITSTAYPDGSTQIIATLRSTINLGDGSPNREAALLSFQVTPPAVGETRIYIMYCLAQGGASNSFSVDPIAEIPIRVTS